MKLSLRRIAFLGLMAAILVPAVAVVPRAAHVFYAGQSLVLAPLALLALLLSVALGPPAGAWGKWPKRLGGALLLALLLLWALAAGLTWQPGWARFVKGLPATDELITAGLRATLGLGALGLGLGAWSQRKRQGALGALPLLGLGLGAWWALSGALSFRPDLAVATLTDWYAYGLVFAAVWALGDTAQRRRRLLGLLLLGGVINAAYGLSQSAGFDPMPWNEKFGGRAAGLLGNPNYLGGHLALLLPLSLALALDTRAGAAMRMGRWAVALVLAAALFATQTRGAWAGAALGCALVLGFAGRLGGGLLKRNRAPLIAGALLLGLGAAAFMAANPKALTRVMDVLQGRDIEAGRRAFLMKKTAQLAAEHPLLGVGPGNYRIWFPSVQVKGLPPQDYRTQAYILSEHGHNDLLQMAADAGVLGALLWAALVFLVLRALALALFKGPAVARGGEGGEGLLVLGALGALAALTVHGLGNFPFLILPTQASAWALAALALRHSQLRPQALAPIAGDELMDEEAQATPAPGPRRRWVALALVAVLGLAFMQARRLTKDMHWWVGEGELGLSHADVASNMLLRTLDFDRREDRVWKLHGRAEFERGFIWNAIGSLREAVRLHPFDAEAAVRLGRACVENKIFDEAQTVLYKVSVYAPNFVDLWEPLAAAYYQQGKFKEAVMAYDWMIYFDNNAQAAYANKAAAQGSLGTLPEALLTLKQAEQRFPLDGKIKINLAITYLKLGMRGEAKAAWKEANRLLPSDPQVDQLRKVLR